MSTFPSYIQLHNNGELLQRAELLRRSLEKCALCPRRCAVNRLKGELGICGAGSELMISSAFAHFGEEPPLVGLRGSGTIFLTHCNLKCVFCQNYDISHLGNGRGSTVGELASIMLELQKMGCHNINFVTPTHYAPLIVSAIDEAAGKGLQLPIVWNCGGYESVGVIKLLDGIVDIYMPDIKFFSEKSASGYCDAPDYPEVVKKVVKEMSGQVGDLTLDSRDIARRGLLVRHLVMPKDVADSEALFRFIAGEISKKTYINIMEQYRPMYRAGEYGEINRPASSKEWRRAVEMAKSSGLNRGF